jgi:MFS transporter, ACS family, allantoate permease
MADANGEKIPDQEEMAQPTTSATGEQTPELADVEKSAVVQVERHPDPTILKHSHDADEAMKAFADREDEVITIDAETDARLLRTIDRYMMPLMCIVYGMNYLDKTTLSYASIMGLQKDINLVGDDYQWLGSMFYFGYLAWEYPTGRLLQRMPLGKYSAVCIIMWGFILSCFAAVVNYSGAIAIRFFLGVFEAAVTPGFALLTSQVSEFGIRRHTTSFFSFVPL